MLRLNCSAVAVLGLTLAMGSSVFGDSFYLTIPEDGSQCVAKEGAAACAPADTVLVDVELTGTGAGTSTATVTFTGETVGTTPYMMYSVLFNVDGSFGISEAAVTVGGVTTDSTPAVVVTSLDEYGSFSAGLTVHDATKVVFDLDGGTWTSAADVLAATTGANPKYYAQGFDAAAQVITVNMGTKMDSGGFEVATPEPTSVLLLGSVLFAVGFATRRKLVR
jgi:PEP-CTERM motif